MMKLSHFAASALRGVLHMICEDRKTGSLTINFSQGTASGMLIWRERETEDLTNRERVESNQTQTNCHS